MQRSQSIQARLNDVETRLRSMRTVTNTASAEISGGETVIDEDGSLYFLDGGRLSLGSSSIDTFTGIPIIDSDGLLVADSIEILGDILSARDYMYQREIIDMTVIDSDEVRSISEETVFEFPDWSSYGTVVINIKINTRVETAQSNPLLVTLNGKPVARPRSDDIGNIQLDTSITRRIDPERPTMRVIVGFDEDPIPVSSPRLSVKVGGVYLA